MYRSHATNLVDRICFRKICAFILYNYPFNRSHKDLITMETTHTFFNIYLLFQQEPESFGYYGNYLAKPEVRAAIHVGNLTYNSGTQVELHLINDVMDTVKPWIATLMENYKVLSVRPSV